MTLADLASEADELARVAKRLPLDNYRVSPEIAMIAKDDLAHALNCLAGKIRKVARSGEPVPLGFLPAERGKFEPGVVTVDGRIVRAEIRNRARV